MFSSIRWRIVFPYAAIIFFATLGLTLFISAQVRQARLSDLETSLLSEARLMSAVVHAHMTDPDEPDMQELNVLVGQWSLMLQQRVTLIDVDGTVLGESDFDLTQMDNHFYRPEIQQAYKEGEGVAVRFSRTANEELMYAAVSVGDLENLLGVLRVSVSLQKIENNVNQLMRAILVAGSVTSLLAIMLAAYVAARTISPVLKLTDTVEKMAAGDMQARLLPMSRDEIGQLTRAFNHMADQLHEKVETLALERSQLSAVLNNMADGVIITDDQGRVALINPAAAHILRVDAQKALGSSFAQVVYDHQLIDMWMRCHASGEAQIETVEASYRDYFLQAAVTPLHGTLQQLFLVILQDLTQVRRLETVRRDFISNVSHELRTPLASLSLVVETLKDGAIEDPPAAQRFLAHMEDELSSLVQMVEELLELSRIESGKVPLTIKPTPLKKLIKKPVKRLEPLAKRLGISLQAALPIESPMVLADAKRIHQVISNLVHNAIKFTPEQGSVTISAKVADDYVEIEVTDTGLGISDADLPRIFERFYKIDRARSEEGTGLGLAISKHLVIAHGGRIWAESVEGVGSTFHFLLPIAQ